MFIYSDLAYSLRVEQNLEVGDALRLICAHHEEIDACA